MGEIYVPLTVINPQTGAQSEPITALVDTGATLAMLPGALLESLGIRKARTVTLALADGRRVVRAVGDAVISLASDATSCRVVFGLDEDAAVLGLTALELLGLVVDPVDQRLVPKDYLLYSLV
ncbi:MAG: Retroviral aspartyl protease [Candidatus Rokubacteria bacterium]|nr:Retroviral aspartyl protease [Candidatus Rokubacteria bacterium]